MNSDRKNGVPMGDAPFDGTFEGTTRRQLLLGLELDATARLRWLEQTMAELRRLCGRASAGDTADPQRSVREKLNEVYQDNKSDLDPALAIMQSSSLPPEEW